jgi:hypothetical protein
MRGRLTLGRYVLQAVEKCYQVFWKEEPRVGLDEKLLGAGSKEARRCHNDSNRESLTS